MLAEKNRKNPANIYFKEIKEGKISGRAILYMSIIRPVTGQAAVRIAGPVIS